MFNNLFPNLMSRAQGVQGPPTPGGALPQRVDPLGGGNPDMWSGALGGDLGTLMMPVLEGLMSEPKRDESLPTPSAPALGRGGQVQPVALPQFNPGSIAPRLRGR